MNHIQKLRDLAKRTIIRGDFDAANMVTAATMSVGIGYVYAPYIPVQFSNISKGSTGWGDPVV